MRKKIISLALISVFAMATALTFNQKEGTNISNITMLNIEALANSESGGGGTGGGSYKYVEPGSSPSVKCVCSGTGSKSCC